MSVERETDTYGNKKIIVHSLDSAGHTLILTNRNTSDNSIYINFGDAQTYHYFSEVREMIAALQEMIGEEETISAPKDTNAEVDGNNVKVDGLEFKF